MLLLKLIKRSIVLLLIVYVYTVVSFRKYTKEDVHKLREEVREMFEHAYSSYLRHAYPYDELRPLSCDGVDTWGSYSLTLIDALDTLAVMGNFTEFQRVVKILTSKSNFDANINVSVFETNIRIVGGLLSAHLLSHRAGVELEPGWPCNGPLLRLAEDVARRLLPAFDTPTGMPYGTVNLRHGVPLGETTITCTAGIGTFVLEFGALSRLTGDPVYEEVALNALHALRHYRSSLGLVGNHIDVATGRWTALDAGIGAGVDSYYEYLAKGAVLLQRPELMKMFQESRVAIDRHLKRDDWHLWVTMTKGQVTLPVFQSLEAYWPGLLSLVGDISTGMKSLHNYHQVWKQYGFTPEFYNIPQGEVGTNREGYPLRPELAESVMYLARATGDPYLLEVGVDILRSIQHSARTPCGYATIKDTRDHRQEDRMESFFLAETTKYLYLLFDPDNFIHNRGQHGTLVKTHWGECVMEAGGYIFNTEAHPLDPGALHCCSEARENPFTFDLDSFRGETLQAHQRRTERQRYLEKQKQKQRQHQRQQEDNARAAEKTVRVTLDAGLTPPSSPVSTSPQESLSPPPPPPSKAEVTVDTDRTAGRKPGNSGDPKESRLVGIGEVVEVQWHTKSEDDVVWHNKAESEDEIRLLSRGQDIKKKQTGDGQIVGYRANENRITPIREGDGPAYTGPFDMTGETVTGISGGAISSSGASASNEEMSAGRNKDKNNDNSSDNRSEKLVELNSDTKEESDDENSEIDRKEGISKQEAVLTEPPTLSSIFGNFLFTSKSNTVEKPPFDPQDLLERIRMRPQYSINSSWSTEFDVLSCGVQPFLQRVSMSGEFFPNS